MKKIHLFLIVSIAFLTAGEIEHYDLNEYRFYKYDLQKLELSPNVSLRLDSHKDKVASDQSDEGFYLNDEEKDRSNRSSFSLQADIDYESIKSDTLRYSLFSMHPSITGEWLYRIDTSDNVRDFSNSSVYDWREERSDLTIGSVQNGLYYLRTRYLSKDKLYFALGTRSSQSYSYNKRLNHEFDSEIDNRYRYRGTGYEKYLWEYHSGDSIEYRMNIEETRGSSDLLSASFSLEPKIGFGRKQSLEQAAIAVHMLKLLKEMELVEDISRSSITAFAHYLDELNTKDYLDTREANVENVSSISHWLSQHFKLDPLPANCVMKIADMWEFRDVQRRSTGKDVELECFYRPNFDYYRQWSEYKQKSVVITTDTANSMTLEQLTELCTPDSVDAEKSGTSPWYFFYAHRAGASLQFSTSKVYGLKRQFSFFGSVSAGAGMYAYEKLKKESLYASMYIRPRYTWYPSLRTTFQLSLPIWYNKDYWPDGQYKMSIDRVTPYVDLSYNYYLTPNLQFTASGDYRFRWRKDHIAQRVTTDKGFSFKIDVTYKIF